mgnify:CR=1 FL=1
MADEFDVAPMPAPGSEWRHRLNCRVMARVQGSVLVPDLNETLVLFYFVDRPDLSMLAIKKQEFHEVYERVVDAAHG